ncbi:MAG: hypothetical protein AVDCRST_MAG68-4450, partial [uncultured Gemmatimonadetes bacterium]
ETDGSLARRVRRHAVRRARRHLPSRRGTGAWPAAATPHRRGRRGTAAQPRPGRATGAPRGGDAPGAVPQTGGPVRRVASGAGVHTRGGRAGEPHERGAGQLCRGRVVPPKRVRGLQRQRTAAPQLRPAAAGGDVPLL